MIRELPRGPFDAYLRAHYFNEKANVLPRFTMGCGAIFMVRRVKALEGNFTSCGVVAETDPLLLQEMTGLVASQSLDVVSLTEMRRRLGERDLKQRFVCFTFDGAYRSVLDVLPVFEAQRMPFALYVSKDYLGTEHVPWWLALESLVQDCDRISIDLEGEPADCRCRSASEKQEVYARLFRRLARLDPERRTDLLGSVFKAHTLTIAAVAQREMLSPDELSRLAQHPLVTLGVLGDGIQPLSELSFDQARKFVEDSLIAVETANGMRPKHLAFSEEENPAVVARNIKIARELGFETAVTSLEGALWPEHARELLALPRIALDNDPATLVRALMLSSGDAQPERRPAKAAV